MASDLFGFGISLFDLAQSAMSSAQSEIFVENVSTAAGEHEL